MKKLKLLIFVILFLFCSSYVNAETYWVSPNGIAAWEMASSPTPLNGEACASLSTANENASAGDIVYLRGGIYREGTIRPVNSGTLSNRIIFAAYPGERSVLDDLGEAIGAPYGYGVLLNGKSYIVIDGITIRYQESPVALLHGASYNEIKNCIIYTALYDPGSISGEKSINIMDGQGNHDGCNHNWIHNNKIYDSGHIGGPNCDDKGGVIQIGAYNSDYVSRHNTIEKNILYWGGHFVVQTNTPYNVIRDNIIHNDAFMEDDNPDCVPITAPWRNGKWGNRCIVINDGNNREGIYNLIEANRIGYASNPPDGGGANGIVLTGKKNIVRHNFVYDAGEKGIYCKQITNGDSDNNRIYNNTLYHIGYSYGQLGNTAFGCIYFSGQSDNNVFKNNLCYDHHSMIKELQGDEGNIVTNNWWTTNGNPSFLSIDMSDPRSENLPDLSLSSSSSCINSGTHLTEANGAGVNSMTLVVYDSLYFQDGSWGSALSDVKADWIAIGTVDNVVQISSIDYSTNTITLKSPMTWSDSAPVWLYKDSTGKQVLYGSAPDIGAYEYHLIGNLSGISFSGGISVQ